VTWTALLLCWMLLYLLALLLRALLSAVPAA
jgi:hypothetical protein